MKCDLCCSHNRRNIHVVANTYLQFVLFNPINYFSYTHYPISYIIDPFEACSIQLQVNQINRFNEHLDEYHLLL